MDRTECEKVKMFSLPRRCESVESGVWLYGFEDTLQIECERKYENLLCRVIERRNGWVSVKADGVLPFYVIPCNMFERLVEQLEENGCHITMKDDKPRKKELKMTFNCNAFFKKKNKDNENIVGLEKRDSFISDELYDTGVKEWECYENAGLDRVCDAVEDVATTRHVLLELSKWFKTGELPLLLCDPLHDDNSNSLLEAIFDYMKNGEYVGKKK